MRSHRGSSMEPENECGNEGGRMRKYTKCECMDYIAVCRRNRIYPVMYCHMEIRGHLDEERLKRAVCMSARYVPEIFYAYDPRHNRFVNRGFTFADVMRPDFLRFTEHPFWNLFALPQMQIAIGRKEQKDEVLIGMSHILSDGAGFLQYLYLLCFLYNGRVPGEDLQNRRDISLLLKGVHVRGETEQTKDGKGKMPEPVRKDSAGGRYFFLKRTISSAEFQELHRKANQRHATVNDVFLAAYGRVLARLQGTGCAAVSCPADLRGFGGEQKEYLTIANMTGMYQNIVVEGSPETSFSAVLSQVSLETRLKKARLRCFTGIRALDFAYGKIPAAFLGGIIRNAYRIHPVAYTNFGVIDDEKLSFDGCRIADCALTGSYRFSPDFQLNISTFRNECTLSCAFVGDAEDAAAARAILEQVQKETGEL